MELTTELMVKLALEEELVICCLVFLLMALVMAGAEGGDDGLAARDRGLCWCMSPSYFEIWM